MFRMEHALNLAWLTVNKIVDGFFMNLPNLLIGLAIVLIFFGAADLSKKMLNNISTKAHVDVTLNRALGALCSILISLLGLLTAAAVVVPHFSMASVIGGLGISSVAIGFAFKDILQNFFAGMLLLWQKPFTIGDEIKTQSFEGTVEDIRIRSTLLRTNDGELAMIPNGDIYTNPVVVVTTLGKRKVKVAAKMPATNSTEETRQKILKLLTSTEGVLRDPAPVAYIIDPSADQLTFEISFWTGAKRAEMMATTDRVATRLRDFANAKTTKVEQPQEPQQELQQEPQQLSKAS